MNTTMPVWLYESSIKFAVEQSRDPSYSDMTQLVFANYAQALRDCYEITRDEFGKEIARLK